MSQLIEKGCLNFLPNNSGELSNKIFSSSVFLGNFGNILNERRNVYKTFLYFSSNLSIDLKKNLVYTKAISLLTVKIILWSSKEHIEILKETLITLKTLFLISLKTFIFSY